MKYIKYIKYFQRDIQTALNLNINTSKVHIVKHFHIESTHCQCNRSKRASHGSQECDSIVAFDKATTTPQ